jgi:hypothetical protein
MLLILGNNTSLSAVYFSFPKIIPDEVNFYDRLVNQPHLS